MDCKWWPTSCFVLQIISEINPPSRPLYFLSELLLKKRDWLRNKFGVPGLYDEFVGEMTPPETWVGQSQAGPEGLQTHATSALGFSLGCCEWKGHEHFGFLIKSRTEFRLLGLLVETAKFL